MSGEPRVLVVDDDVGLLEVIAAILEPLGMTVATVSRASEALQLLAKSQFDLVVSDLSMPGVDGHDLIGVIRGRGDPTPILFLSGTGKVPDIVKLMRAGASGYLEKPFDPSALKHEVLAALRTPPNKLPASSNPSIQLADADLMDATLDGLPPKSPPRKLGRYELRDVLAAGGMGRVYRAWDPNLDREVAIKVLRMPESDSERSQFPARFRREAVALAKLRHPHIVAVFDCDIDGASGVPYVVMELVHGEALSTLLKRTGKLPLSRALHIAQQLADALAFSHAHGIVHRDVKPDNVIIEKDDFARLIDFGVARMDDANQTVGAFVLGTPNYLSPEAARSHPIDARADQFSLATVIFEMLTGTKPFAADRADVIIFNVIEEPAPTLASLGVKAPVAVQELLTKMHAKDPADRVQDDDDLRRALAVISSIIV